MPNLLPDPVCVPDRHSVIPGGGPVGATAPPPVPEVGRARPTYTLITQRRDQHAVGYRAPAVAIAGAGGLFLTTGWLVVLAVTVAITAFTAAAILGRQYRTAGRPALTARPRLELTR